MPVLDVTIVGKMMLPEVGGGPVYPPGSGSPPGIWGPTDPRPSHPIVLPIPPDGLAPGLPAHPIYLPVFPAHPIVIPPGAIAPGVPAHPIYLPPGIWGPTDPQPGPPIYIPPDLVAPGVPAHPIYLPPTIWPPGGGIDVPGHPIVLPPGPVEPPPGGGDKPPPPGGGWGYVSEQGWGWGYFPQLSDKPNPVPPGRR